MYEVISGMKLAELRDVTTDRKQLEKDGHWSRQPLELNELTAQGDKVSDN